jgi:hypothetical protein
MDSVFGARLVYLVDCALMCDTVYMTLCYGGKDSIRSIQ